ncbi:Thyroid adenoma-associated protein, partial [Linum perenne]
STSPLFNFQPENKYKEATLRANFGLPLPAIIVSETAAPENGKNLVQFIGGMSAKWRALQHRHRYTYSAVIFPPSYADALSHSLLASNPKCSAFVDDLNKLISLTSIYTQVAHVKSLASSFSNLVRDLETDESFLELASRFYLEVLFMENSPPLHRTLVSGLARVSNADRQSLIHKCFSELCKGYGSEKGKGVLKKRFCLSKVALSFMGMPKLGYLVDIIEDCVLLVAWDVVIGLESVVLETEKLARPSPIVLEQCQDALSCLYYLLQRFPDKLKHSNHVDGGDGLSILERVFEVLISVLKSLAFTRDCFVAAGVGLCAALQASLSDEELGLLIVEGILNHMTLVSVTSNHADGEFRDAILKVPYRGDFCLEIRNLSLLSRLCLIRGILTAVSRTVLNRLFVMKTCDTDQLEGKENSGTSVKTILYDGILPELCNYCENPTDSHFNFHALTVMQICLQQMKTSMLSRLTALSDDYNPIPDEMETRILRIIWNNLEDPLSQTVKQVHLTFDLYLDIQSTLHSGADSKGIKLFLENIALHLLHMGPRCKGRYAPLSSLTKRLGSQALLDMYPDLMYETAHAYVDDDVCCALTSFLKCFLEYLRDECWANNGVETGYELYRRYSLPPFLCGLASGISKLRSNLNTYALPVLLEVDVDSIFPMLSFISIGPDSKENGISSPKLARRDLELGIEEHVAVLVSLLKVSRSLALLDGDIDLSDDASAVPLDGEKGAEIVNSSGIVRIKGVMVKVPVEWLVMALTHVDESLRVDAAETLFLNPKTSSLPSHLELSLLKEAVPLNMRSCSTGFQMKWSSLFRKFFSRVRTALERQFKQGGWKPSAKCKLNEPCSNGKAEVKRAEELFSFMRWLGCFLFFSCYPSAPYRRKIMAMELIQIMLNVWSIKYSKDVCENFLSPYSKAITSPDSTLLLVGSVVDSWDRLRESSFRILLHFPTPLPGVDSAEMVKKLIIWAQRLVCSPRVRESDAGALTLRLIFQKYVLELGWVVRASVNVVCFESQYQVSDNGVAQMVKSTTPIVEYVKSLIDWLKVAVEEGEKDLYQACRSSFVHGILLALRYTFEELDWNSDAVMSNGLEMRSALEKLLDLVTRITCLALGVVSADAWYLPDGDELVDEDAYLGNEMDMGELSSEHGIDSKLQLDSRMSEQIVMVGCWLAMKEVSLLLGTVIRKVPLPTNSCPDLMELAQFSDDASLGKSNAILDIERLEQMGNHFLEVLLKMKHNGAIDKTRAGFTALCNRLLCSNDPELCRLTESWMEQLMERTVVKGQTVDDLLRRSAGIPAAFIALFLSEPEGSPKKLLPRALRWLIDVANGSLLRVNDADSSRFPSSNSDQDPDSLLQYETSVMEKASKVRDEGVVPMVHAFNSLRAAFNDTNLATDTSGFAAEALIVSVSSFSSPYWEIRNAACLAYTALLRRMVGFLNVLKRESARRALTGLEFFHRYPLLHPFFYKQLKVATDLLEDARPGHSGLNLEKVVHPSLCPMLILLSRLKPSAISSEKGDDLDPFLFMPFIRKCSTQSNLRVRVLAAKALNGLVSNEKLASTLLIIASDLPFSASQVGTTSSSIISATDGIHCASFNSIHGMLLQIGSLLDANCRDLADVGKKEKILGDLLQILVERSWIACPKQCSCPILNTSFLRVVDHMLSISRTGYVSVHYHMIRKLLVELSTGCLDVEDSYGMMYYDPTVAELREQATISYFSCVLQTSKDETEGFLKAPKMSSLPEVNSLNQPETVATTVGLQERLTLSLKDSAYEVRLATLKWLVKFLRSTAYSSGAYNFSSGEMRTIQQWTRSSLQTTMMNLLDVEKNRRCIYYILRVIFTWNRLLFENTGDQDLVDTEYVGQLDLCIVGQFWDKLVSLYKVTKHSKTKEKLICCMAICVKRFASLLTSFVLSTDRKKIVESAQPKQLEDPAYLIQCITFFVTLIKEHGSSSEPVNMRMAVAESIIASGLLEQAEFIGSSVYSYKVPSDCLGANFGPETNTATYALQVLEIWFASINLLEDEDDGIREEVARNVQKCFHRKVDKNSSQTCGVPTQVERVIELSFWHLSSIFGHWISYLEYLTQWVFDIATSVVSTRDLVRRVFDKEIDNHHEEKLLICQICCFHLEKLSVLNSSSAENGNNGELRNYLHSSRRQFGEQLKSYADDFIEKLGGIDWIGGAGNHKDAFLPVYANLLGFYALSNCILKGEDVDIKSLSVDVVDLEKRINLFFTNPLIYNLFSLVVKSHEKKGAVSCCKVIDDALSDGFSPYFLLR